MSSHDRDLFASGKEMTWSYVKNLAIAQDRIYRERSPQSVISESADSGSNYKVYVQRQPALSSDSGRDNQL